MKSASIRLNFSLFLFFTFAYLAALDTGAAKIKLRLDFAF